jgi:hypothetical protein
MHVSDVREIRCSIVLSLLVTVISTVAFGQAPPAQAVQGLVRRYGDGFVSGAVVDSISDGKLTIFTARGAEATFDVTVVRKGRRQVQRIIKQPGGQVLEGSDGNRSWSSLAGRYSTDAQGPALRFIESQTARSVQTLLNHQSEGLVLGDSGARGAARVIDAEDRQGRRTSYYIDSATSAVTKIEFVIGQATDPFSKKTLPSVESYVFSDFRIVQGLFTPFKVERYFNAIKTEEMQFTTVRYNASVDDNGFRP